MTLQPEEKPSIEDIRAWQQRLREDTEAGRSYRPDGVGGEGVPAELAGPWRQDEAGTFNSHGWGFGVLLPDEFWGVAPDELAPEVQQTAATLERMIRESLGRLPALPVEGGAVHSALPRCAHCVATDGPHAPGDQRFWLARKLMDSKLSDAEAFGVVAFHPDIHDLASALTTKGTGL